MNKTEIKKIKAAHKLLSRRITSYNQDTDKLYEFVVSQWIEIK